MKIVRLTSENVKRLSIVEITPEGPLVTIGGKNGAGKSSVLDSIAYVLGGEKLVPTQPIRTGESQASIKLDLGDYIVTRKFTRDHLTCNCAASPDEPANRAEQHSPSCASRQWGPTKSTITVTNPEGAKYPSPQALLDKLYGKLTFDPLAFSKEKEAVQNEILRRIVGLDFTTMDAERTIIFQQRAINKKTLSIEQGKLEVLPKHPSKEGIYVVETKDVDELSKRLQLGQTIEAEARDAESAAHRQQSRLDELHRDRQDRLNRIDALKQQLADAEAGLAKCDESIREQKTAVEQHNEIARQRSAAVPDFTALHAELAELHRANERARDNKAYLLQASRVKELEGKVVDGTKAIEQIDADKEAKLKAAAFPVEGLSITDDGVTFEGLPLQEVSASVQLRVSIAIGLALNPTLKVLLIRNGNLLDDDSLALVAKQAEEAGAQVWMEYVTSDSGDVSVMLEDGHVA